MRSVINPPAIIFPALVFLFSVPTGIVLANVTFPPAVIVFAMAPFAKRET